MGAEEGTSTTTVISSFGGKWKTALCILKKNEKGKEMAPKALLSSLQAACMTLAVTLLEVQIFVK